MTSTISLIKSKVTSLSPVSSARASTMSSNINDLEAVVSSFIPKNYTFVDAQLQNLTSSGENYGSLLLSVDITTKDESDENRHIYAVAKKLPSNELVQKMFNSQCTFPNEVGFYQTIAPCMQDFQKQQGVINVITSFPKFYAARVSRDSSGNVDQSSVLLIKNIKKEGFDILDRTVGFDFDQSRLVLEKMAEMHATVIALKLQNPKAFEEQVVPMLAEYDTFVMDDESNDKMIRGALDVVKDDEICCRYLSQLENIMRTSCITSQKKNVEVVPENPFSTLVHSDMWTNNIMLKVINGTAIDVKFVDFQLYEFASLTRDVVFFIYSSIKTDVLTNKCDDLFRHYYNNLINWLKRVNCDVGSFSFGAFIQDMKIMVQKFEFFHIMTMLAPIYATSKDTRDVEQLEMDSFIFYGTEVTETYKEKACFIVRDFVHRGWLP